MVSIGPLSGASSRTNPHHVPSSGAGGGLFGKKPTTEGSSLFGSSLEQTPKQPPPKPKPPSEPDFESQPSLLNSEEGGNSEEGDVSALALEDGKAESGLTEDALAGLSKSNGGAVGGGTHDSDGSVLLKEGEQNVDPGSSSAAGASTVQLVGTGIGWQWLISA